MNITATRFTTQARTWILIAGLGALLIVLGGQLFGGSGYLLFAAFSVIMTFVSYWFSAKFAIRAELPVNAAKTFAPEPVKAAA